MAPAADLNTASWTTQRVGDSCIATTGTQTKDLFPSANQEIKKKKVHNFNSKFFFKSGNKQEHGRKTTPFPGCEINVLSQHLKKAL